MQQQEKVSAEEFLALLEKERTQPEEVGLIDRIKRSYTLRAVAPYAKDLVSLLEQNVSLTAIHRWLEMNQVKCSYVWLTLNREVILEVAKLSKEEIDEATTRKEK